MTNKGTDVPEVKYRIETVGKNYEFEAAYHQVSTLGWVSFKTADGKVVMEFSPGRVQVIRRGVYDGELDGGGSVWRWLRETPPAATFEEGLLQAIRDRVLEIDLIPGPRLIAAGEYADAARYLLNQIDILSGHPPTALPTRGDEV